MASTQRLTRISKFLSLVLRHEPETIGLSLDDAGWLDTDALLKGCAKAGRPLSRAELELVVEQNDKRRFVIDGKRIRANQGHSRAAVLELAPSLPPQQLYHGSAERFLESILREGLQRKNRQHVHLSLDVTNGT